MFFSGLYALILMLVNVQATWLKWLDAAGTGIGFVAKLVLVLAGAAVMVLSTVNWQREREEVEAYLAARSYNGRTAQKN